MRAIKKEDTNESQGERQGEKIEKEETNFQMKFISLCLRSAEE
jgi:hypothetical protein